MPTHDRLTEFEAFPDSALLSAHDIRYLSGRSLSSIWRDVKRKRLPAPVAIGPNASRWRAIDVKIYLKGQECHA